MSSAPVPVLASIRAAYAFLTGHARAVLLAGLPYTTVYALWLGGSFGPGHVAQGGIGLALSLAVSLASIAMSAAALRLAVRGEHAGPLGLQLGRDELRLFLVALLVFLLAGIVFILVYLFWGVIFLTVAGGAMERAGLELDEESGFELAQALGYLTPADWAVTGLSGAGCAAIVIWLLARLTLALPASFAAGRIQVMKAWPLSDGNGWRLALCLVLTGLPLLAIELGLYELLSALAGGSLLDMNGRYSDAGSELPAVLRLREYQTWLGLFAAVNLPVFAGLYAFIYKDRTGASAAG